MFFYSIIFVEASSSSPPVAVGPSVMMNITERERKVKPTTRSEKGGTSPATNVNVSDSCQFCKLFVIKLCDRQVLLIKAFSIIFPNKSIKMLVAYFQSQF